MKMAYQSRPGFRLAGKVEDVGRRIDELSAQNGGSLKPSVVVDDARQPGSPLHGEFDWDVDAAALKHWEERARYLMRSFVKVYIKDDGSPTGPVIAHVKIRDEDGKSSYRRIEDVALNDDWQAQVLADVRRQILGLKARLKILANAGPIIRALAEAEQAIDAREAQREKRASARAGKPKPKRPKVLTGSR